VLADCVRVKKGEKAIRIQDKPVARVKKKV